MCKFDTFIKELIKKSQADTLGKAALEWEHTGTSMSHYNEKNTCICGTRISHLFEITNKVNGKVITVGSVCIGQIHIEVPKLNESIQKAARALKWGSRKVCFGPCRGGQTMSGMTFNAVKKDKNLVKWCQDHLSELTFGKNRGEKSRYDLIKFLSY